MARRRDTTTRAVPKAATTAGNGRGGPRLPAARARTAIAVDPAIRSGNLNRLRRIEGQVRGLQRMVEEDRYCADILVQLASVQQALRAVGRELLRNHLRHCVRHSVSAGGGDAEAMFSELVDLFDRHQ